MINTLYLVFLLTLQIFDEDLSNYSLSCKNDDDAISSCLVHTECATDTYASAVCFKEGQVVDEGNALHSILIPNCCHFLKKKKKV